MKLATRSLPLVIDGYRCVGGPLDGATLYLSENSPNTARIECKALHGRYVTDTFGRLVWEGTA